MFQTDQPTAVSALPAPATAGTQGFFTNGSPVSGMPSTILDADFMNMVMMELVNVVEAAGLTPSKTTYNQLLSALQVLFAGQVTGATNYIKIPVTIAGVKKNLIIQWGTTSFATGVNSVAQTLPVAWPTGYLGGVASDTGAVCNPCGVSVNGLNQIAVYTSAYNVSTGSVTAHSAIVSTWIVIGY